MAIIIARATLIVVVVMTVELCAVGKADTVRTINPPRLPGFPALPPLPGHSCPRPGLCPQIRRLPVRKREAVTEVEVKVPVDPPSLCGNLCTKDDACPVGKKCCPTTCGYACYDPVFVVDTV